MQLSAIIKFRIDPETKNLIRRAAQAQGRTLSNYIRHATTQAVMRDLATVDDKDLVDHDTGNDNA